MSSLPCLISKFFAKLLRATLIAWGVIFDNTASFSSQITLNSHACCSRSSNSAQKTWDTECKLRSCFCSYLSSWICRFRFLIVLICRYQTSSLISLLIASSKVSSFSIHHQGMVIPYFSWIRANFSSFFGCFKKQAILSLVFRSLLFWGGWSSDITVIFSIIVVPQVKFWPHQSHRLQSKQDQMLLHML